MQAACDAAEAVSSPAKGRGLVMTALAAALLGLTLLDVAPSVTHKRVPQERSVDCIVASAVFAGVSAAGVTPLP